MSTPNEELRLKIEELLAGSQKGPDIATAVCTSAGTQEGGPTITLAKLEAILAKIGPEPIGEWMRNQGFPPESSLLLLPLTMREELPVWPRYVRFSTHIESPTLVKDPSHAFGI